MNSKEYTVKAWTPWDDKKTVSLRITTDDIAKVKANLTKHYKKFKITEVKK